MIKIYEFGSECYFIDKERKIMYLTLDNGNFKIQFDMLDEMISKYKTANRIHKPVFMLLYTDFKNNKITENKWKFIEVDYSTEFKTMIEQFPNYPMVI